MLPGRTYTLDEVLRLIRQRWLLILLPLALGAGAGFLLFKLIPPRYQSETVILVVPQRVPESYVKAIDTMSVEDRIRSVSEQIQTRPRLTRIIQDYDLYKEERVAGITDRVVQRMRLDIEVDLIDDMSFQLTYIHSDPVIAQKVTEQLAALYIEENLRDRVNMSEGTSRFLESELQNAKTRLVEQEKKLEEYRRRHAGQLPSQLEGNLQFIQNTQVQLHAVSESMNRARERRLLIERQVADMQGAAVELIAIARPDPTTPATAAQQLEAARARLAELKLRYTQEYPDVQAAEQTIRELQAKAEEEARRPTDSQRSISPFEAARAKRLKDLQAEQAIIDNQLVLAQAEQARLKQAIADHQAKVDVVPTRESELVELTRDYSTIQQAYATLLQKREDSKVAANLERRQIAEHFKVLDPPSLPDGPHNQGRRLAALFGGPVGGLALGLLLIGILEFRDSTFKREEDVLRVLSLPVLALIPVIDVRAHDEPGRRRGTIGRLITAASGALGSKTQS